MERVKLRRPGFPRSVSVALASRAMDPIIPAIRPIRSMTGFPLRTPAQRRVFRQGNGIKPHFQHTPQYFSPICRCSGMCETSLLKDVGHCPGHGRIRVGVEEAIIPWPLLARSAGTSEPCQYPDGHHRYQSQRDDECNENPCVAEPLFGLRLRASAPLDFAGSPDCLRRRAADLLIDAHGDRTGIEIRHERKTLKQAAMFRGE